MVEGGQAADQREVSNLAALAVGGWVDHAVHVKVQVVKFAQRDHLSLRRRIVSLARLALRLRGIRAVGGELRKDLTHNRFGIFLFQPSEESRDAHRNAHAGNIMK